jgi:antirestriction protein ArdC
MSVNTDQCEGLPEEVAASVVPPPPGQIEPRAEALIAATGADFRIGGERAYYNTTDDFVQVPPPAAYFEPINWHRIAFHELGHWTGHTSRLNRDHLESFGSKSYAREELVAEMAGAFVCASLGIVPTVRHADLHRFLAGDAARGYAISAPPGCRRSTRMSERR